MAMPEYVSPILAADGSAALLVVAVRFSLNALARLVISALAIMWSNKQERLQTCITVLHILSGKQDDLWRASRGRRGARAAPKCGRSSRLR